VKNAEVLGKVRSHYSELVDLLKPSKLRQSLQFHLARFEADLLAIECLADEAADLSNGADQLFAVESFSRLLPDLILKFRGLALEIERERLKIPDRLIERIGELEQALASAGPVERAAAERVLGL